jgi:hypothetical protein
MVARGKLIALGILEWERDDRERGSRSYLTSSFSLLSRVCIYFQYLVYSFFFRILLFATVFLPTQAVALELVPCRVRASRRREAFV